MDTRLVTEGDYVILAGTGTDQWLRCDHVVELDAWR